MQNLDHDIFSKSVQLYGQNISNHIVGISYSGCKLNRSSNTFLSNNINLQKRNNGHEELSGCMDLNLSHTGTCFIIKLYPTCMIIRSCSNSESNEAPPPLPALQLIKCSECCVYSNHNKTMSKIILFCF